MDTLVNFLRENWQFISSAILALLTIIAMLIKRKPKTIDDFIIGILEVINDLPEFINEVEEVGNGLSKKIKVQQFALNDLKSRLKRTLTKTELSQALCHIDDALESILSTPQKKSWSYQDKFPKTSNEIKSYAKGAKFIDGTK